MTGVYRFHAKLTLRAETHTKGSGVMEQAATLDKEDLSRVVDVLTENSAIYKCIDEVQRFRNCFRRHLPGVSLLPRFYRSDGRVTIYIPGSSIKGVLRAALDQKAIKRAVERLRNKELEVPEEVASELKQLCGESFKKEEDPFRALFIDRLSHSALSIVCESSYALQNSDKRRRLVSKIAELLGVDAGELIHHESLALGLSELLFGTTGLRSSIYVSNFHLASDVEPYAKVFNAVAWGRVASPFYLELLPHGAEFKGVIEFKPTPFTSYRDFEEMICTLTENGKLTLQIGGRRKLGWGLAELTLHPL